MYYIIRAWIDGQPFAQTFDSLEEARTVLHMLTVHAELYVFLNGREEFMESNICLDFC